MIVYLIKTNDINFSVLLVHLLITVKKLNVIYYRYRTRSFRKGDV